MKEFRESEIVYHNIFGKGIVISYSKGLYDVRFGENTYSIDGDFLTPSSKPMPQTMSKPKGVIQYEHGKL